VDVTPWFVAVALVGALTSYVLVGLARDHGWRLGLVDRPREGEVQERAVPRSGGYGMLVGLWIAIGASLLLRPAGVDAPARDDFTTIGMLLGSALVLPLAVLDDRRRLGPLPQFLGQCVVAAVPIGFGLRIGSIASPFGPALELAPWVDVVFTFGWILGMINAINLIDVMDGLAAGIVAMAAIVLFMRSVWFGQPSIAVLPLALAACALGFLPRNFHPATVFMGTSGSILLGYALATTSVIGGAKVGTAFAVLAFPILDTAWVMLRRIARGRSPFQGGDREHLPQKLHWLGLSQLQTVLLLYMLSAVFGFLSLSLHSPATGPGIEKLFLLVGLAALMLLVLAVVTLLVVRKEHRLAAGTPAVGPQSG
jgi:UDP-GlcNAc:undecaprenyl-phosphate/decaprenyl-phosphate GlcNAc-1-phosphate transferase